MEFNLKENPPTAPQSGGPENKKFLAGFVLQKFNKDEEMIVKGVIEKTIEAINTVIKEGLEKAMSKFNK